jgi:uncharacterized protein (TIGR04222 family)
MYLFNLPGPQFLLFYALFALAVIGACAFVTHFMGPSKPVSYTELTSDPYLIAYLRDGAQEAIKVAIFNLEDRGILEFDSGLVIANKRVDPGTLRRPFDRAVVSRCEQLVIPKTLLYNAALTEECDRYQAELERRGLLSDAQARSGHMKVFLVALSLLAGVALVKIVAAVEAGHPKMEPFVMLGLMACFVAFKAAMPRTTPAGRATLSGLDTLLKRLMSGANRLRAGGATNEAFLLAAVAGIDALPAAQFARAQRIFPAKRSSRDEDSEIEMSCSSGSSGCGGGGGCGGCGG